ncbi:hypothetical protein GCM10012275_08970 [Longimycelium tulufanense]|uniref:Peptidase S26 domain-containing protein n=1 Tax=Longimycelium tulufanense TaxID=907463 RepID=A0A8J3FSW6_9PSEU|nr:S26 family signal peptidase [Longimycelium tulufanense]GGM40198.1 hypothetical protein GCM10012275_08970 [Longimycelium tulufanense]
MSSGSSPSSRAVPDHDTRAETAVDRALARSRHARASRVALYAVAVALWSGTAALLTARSPVWAMLCGVPALLVSAGAALTRAAERRMVAVSVSGRSMEPAYRDGDQVLVRRRMRPARGTVVVVERPPFRAPWPEPPVSRTAPAHVIYARQWYIKRVAAVPGDPVPRSEVPALADVPGQSVPEGMLVLLGDNKDESYDSRYVGYFPAARVLGTVAGSGQSTARMRNT